MDQHSPNPLQILSRRLHMMGNLLAFLCCAWIGVVGVTLLRDVNADHLHNHRSPQTQRQLQECEGSFAQRFACTDDILLQGGRLGASEVALRLLGTLVLPTVAWSMWRAVLERTDRLSRPATPLEPHHHRWG